MQPLTGLPLSQLQKRLLPVASLLGTGLVLSDATGQCLAAVWPAGQTPPPEATPQRLLSCPLPVGHDTAVLALLSDDPPAQARIAAGRTQAQAWLRQLAGEIAPLLGRPGESQVWPITFADLHGTEPDYVATRKLAQRAAGTDSTVLVRGESGTGKELFARAIHAESPLAAGPFVAINCAAIPEHLLESELFGYEDGAFTGARRGGKPGRLEMAAGGTLFLDEIADLPLHLQAKLLRVLQFREVERVGGTRPVPLSFRLIAATNKSLEDEIARRSFREDLYYRLNVISLTIPPLRQRRDDLVLLLELFTKRTCLRLNLVGKRWSAEALGAVLAYRWPGNVRELENVIERAAVLCSSELISLEYLPTEVRDSPRTATPVRRGAREQGGPSPEQILAVLSRHGNTALGREAAARELGLSRATLYRRLQRLRASQ